MCEAIAAAFVVYVMMRIGMKLSEAIDHDERLTNLRKRR